PDTVNINTDEPGQNPLMRGGMALADWLLSESGRYSDENETVRPSEELLLEDPSYYSMVLTLLVDLAKEERTRFTP
ncbi:MAG: hypothetical protein ACFCU3_11315, partial [Verrucomicrobiales bacterium]